MNGAALTVGDGTNDREQIRCQMAHWHICNLVN